MLPFGLVMQQGDFFSPKSAVTRHFACSGSLGPRRVQEKAGYELHFSDALCRFFIVKKQRY